MEGEEGTSYAGRWVARLRGKVVAQGGSPEQALRAAQLRYKEKPEIVYMPASYQLNFPKVLDSVRKALPAGVKVYLVGGAVRDALLGIPIHDMDFSLAEGAIKTARRVANKLNADFYPLDSERDTGRVIQTVEDGSRLTLDFAAFRGSDLSSDLAGRDFTLDAIALDLEDNSLHDPLGGAMDLKEKRLMLCSPTSILDDPVRILRGVRLAAGLGLHIPILTRKAMKEAAWKLGNVSPERTRDELFRILEGPTPSACMRALDILDALNQILPELSGLKGVTQRSPHEKDVWEHTLATLGHLETILDLMTKQFDQEKAASLFNGLMVMQLGRFRDRLRESFGQSTPSGRSLRGLLFLAALYHDIAKPATRQEDENGHLRFWGHETQGAEVAAKRAKALALSNEEIQRLDTIIRNHMRMPFKETHLGGKPVSRRSIYRFFRDTREAGVDICLLELADLRATFEQNLSQERWSEALGVVEEYLENWYERPADSVTPPALVDGNDLMKALSLSPGPMIGELLEAVRESQAAGEISTREEALLKVQEWLEEKRRQKRNK